jgi:flavin reductase (DIM6/NTAB) family NADH-FMN oxidoreductase RutF
VLASAGVAARASTLKIIANAFIFASPIEATHANRFARQIGRNSCAFSRGPKLIWVNRCPPLRDQNFGKFVGIRPMRTLALSKVYRLLEPGPVVLLTTSHKGRANVMTMSWHMMIEFEPPRIACVVSGANYSFAALRTTGECVIAIPARKLATAIVKVGNSSGRDTDKFAAFGLTKVAAAQVQPPLIGECFANLECRVTDEGWVDKYNLFVLEVRKAWIDPRQKHPKTLHHHGYGKFVVDGPAITLASRMR